MAPWSGARPRNRRRLERSDDVAYQSALRNPALRYKHLMLDSELWIPTDFSMPLRTRSVVGDSITVGSSMQLLAELQELNGRTWAADSETIRKWREEETEYGAGLETTARFAFAVFWELANESVHRRLPMKLDY